MKSHIMPGVALMVILFSGNLMAATNMTDNVTLNNDKISGQAGRPCVISECRDSSCLMVAPKRRNNWLRKQKTPER